MKDQVNLPDLRRDAPAAEADPPRVAPGLEVDLADAQRALRDLLLAAGRLVLRRARGAVGLGRLDAIRRDVLFGSLGVVVVGLRVASGFLGREVSRIGTSEVDVWCSPPSGR